MSKAMKIYTKYKKWSETHQPTWETDNLMWDLVVSFGEEKDFKPLATPVESESQPQAERGLVSKCCSSAMKVVGGDEGTNHYECLECGKSCDFKPQPQAGSECKCFFCDNNKTIKDFVNRHEPQPQTGIEKAYKKMLDWANKLPEEHKKIIDMLSEPQAESEVTYDQIIEHHFNPCSTGHCNVCDYLKHKPQPQAEEIEPLTNAHSSLKMLDKINEIIETINCLSKKGEV